ncbi:hypothetical protein BU17DRAFT_98924 [Hysterangium stoloniferum]|nr:hypothetical protein BU17DRAFT_98924 [Hysterangium stoloniferum]
MSSHIHPSSFHVTRLLWSGLVRFRTWHSRFHHRLAVWTSTNPIQQGNLLASVHAPNRILPTTGSPRFSEFDARVTWLFSPVTVPPYRSSPLQERHHIVIEDAVVDTITKPETYRPHPISPSPTPSLPPACHGTRIAHLSPISLSLSLPLPAFSPVTVPPYRPSPLQDRHHVVIEDAAADAPAPYRTRQPARQPHPISLSSPPLPAFSPVTVPPYRPSPLQERHHVVIEDAAVDAPMPYRTPCLSLSLSPSSGILACLGTCIVHPSPSRRTTKTKSPSLHRHQPRQATLSYSQDCLYPSATFGGTQESGRSSYEVSVTIVVRILRFYKERLKLNHDDCL